MIKELEIWLIGTSAELDASVRAFAGIGRIVLPEDPADRPKRHPLVGADAGRYRLYLRVAVATVRRPATTEAEKEPGATLIDLASRRRTA